MAYKFSLAFLTLLDCEPSEAIRIAAEAGYDMVGLRLLPAAPNEAPYPILSDERVLKEAVSALKETGMVVADVEIVRLKPETNVSDFQQFLASAARLGAHHVLVAGDDPDKARLTDRFASLCQLAAGYGLTADLEFMPWTNVPDLKAALSIVEGAGEPNGGVLIDALHFARSTTTLEEVTRVPRRLINYVQFCDGPADYDPSHDGLIKIARGERLFPGEGNVDCVGLARVIPPDATISVEVPNLDLVKRLSPLERAQAGLSATRRVLGEAMANRSVVQDDA